MHFGCYMHDIREVRVNLKPCASAYIMLIILKTFTSFVHHVSFWCLYLDAHPTTQHSTIRDACVCFVAFVDYLLIEHPYLIGVRYNEHQRTNPKRDQTSPLGGCTQSYILHTRAFTTYLLGGYLPCKKDYKVMVFYM